MSIQYSDLREAAQQALEVLEYYQHRRLEWDYSDEVAITALRAALAEPPVDDPHRDHWVAIAEAAQKIAASKECGPAEAKALCAALDRLTDAALAEPVQEPQRKPLTEEEITALSQQHKFDARMEKFVRIIERAHGITGGSNG